MLAAGAEAYPSAFSGAARTWSSLDMDVLDIGAIPGWGDEAIGPTTWEVMEAIHEAGKAGIDALSFQFIAPDSPPASAIACYGFVYLLAGWVLGSGKVTVPWRKLPSGWTGRIDMRDARQLAVGLKVSRSVKVTDEMTPAHLRSEPIRVLSTPDMIRLIEQTAIEAVAPCLQPGQATVGTRVDVAHLAATPVGMTVTITVELTEIDRR